MEKNIKTYQKSKEKNLLDIKKILKNRKITNPDISIYNTFFEKSIFFITNKWQSGKKYSRTFFIQNIFQKKYPQKYTELSLSIDAMVNILDDLYDENLNSQEKGIYVLEFLRIFSIYSNKTNIKVDKFLSNYINKLITLAVAENFYQEKIKLENNLDIIINDSADLLICRGMDIDIFVQIALLDKKLKDNLKKEIENIGRIFRAINILKKDINDIDYDKKNNMETVVTIILEKKEINFQEYVNKLIENLFIKQKAYIDNILKKDKSFLSVINNFQKAFDENKKEILFSIKNK